jgi:hypothetical protein
MNVSKTLLSLMIAGSCFAGTLAPASAQSWNHNDHSSSSSTTRTWNGNSGHSGTIPTRTYGTPPPNGATRTSGNPHSITRTHDETHGRNGYNYSSHDYRRGYDRYAWQREHDREWRDWESRHHRRLTWRQVHGVWSPGYYLPGGIWINVNL